jgi:hypothetical protein
MAAIAGRSRTAADVMRAITGDEEGITTTVTGGAEEELTVGVHLWAGVPIRGLLMAGNSAGAFRSVRSGIAPNAGSSLERFRV